MSGRERAADTTAWETEREASRLLFQKGLTSDDTDWLREQFNLAGLPTPDVDVSWVQMETIGASDLPWPLIILLGVPILAIIVGLVLRAFGVQT